MPNMAVIVLMTLYDISTKGIQCMHGISFVPLCTGNNDDRTSNRGMPTQATEALSFKMVTPHVRLRPK